MKKYLNTLLLSLALVSTTLLASDTEAEGMSRPKSEATMGQFDDKTYQLLFKKADEDYSCMTPNRQKAAKRFEGQCPVFTGVPSFYEKVERVGHFLPPFRLRQKTYTDDMGRLWYVIDYTGSKMLHKTSGMLFESAASALVPDHVVESSVLVRSRAFKNPSRYGMEYVIRNNKDVGKLARMWFILYPAW